VLLLWLVFSKTAAGQSKPVEFDISSYFRKNPAIPEMTLVFDISGRHSFKNYNYENGKQDSLEFFKNERLLEEIEIVSVQRNNLDRIISQWEEMRGDIYRRFRSQELSLTEATEEIYALEKEMVVKLENDLLPFQFEVLRQVQFRMLLSRQLVGVLISNELSNAVDMDIREMFGLVKANTPKVFESLKKDCENLKSRILSELTADLDDEARSSFLERWSSDVQRFPMLLLELQLDYEENFLPEGETALVDFYLLPYIVVLGSGEVKRKPRVEKSSDVLQKSKEVFRLSLPALNKDLQQKLALSESRLLKLQALNDEYNLELESLRKQIAGYPEPDRKRFAEDSMKRHLDLYIERFHQHLSKNDRQIIDNYLMSNLVQVLGPFADLKINSKNYGLTEADADKTAAKCRQILIEGCPEIEKAILQGLFDGMNQDKLDRLNSLVGKEFIGVGVVSRIDFWNGSLQELR
jgi:hypothetical protein